MQSEISKLWISIVAGAFMFILPVLGIPRDVKAVLFSMGGLLVAVLSFMVAKSIALHDALHVEQTEPLHDNKS